MTNTSFSCKLADLMEDVGQYGSGPERYNALEDLYNFLLENKDKLSAATKDIIEMHLIEDTYTEFRHRAVYYLEHLCDVPIYTRLEAISSGFRVEYFYDRFNEETVIVKSETENPTKNKNY
jgi:hypothetical protein